MEKSLDKSKEKRDFRKCVRKKNDLSGWNIALEGREGIKVKKERGTIMCSGL